MSSQIQPKYLNVREAAKYCGLSERTLKRRIKERRFKTFSRGRVLIDRESLDAWIGGVKQAPEAARLHPEDIEAIAAAVVRLLRAPEGPLPAGYAGCAQSWPEMLE